MAAILFKRVDTARPRHGQIIAEAGRGSTRSVVARLDRAIQYSTAVSDRAKGHGVLDTRFRGYDD